MRDKLHSPQNPLCHYEPVLHGLRHATVDMAAPFVHCTLTGRVFSFASPCPVNLTTAQADQTNGLRPL